jgi:hypothetical protein
MAEGMEPVASEARSAVVAFPAHVDRSNVAQVRDELLAVIRLRGGGDDRGYVGDGVV